MAHSTIDEAREPEELLEGVNRSIFMKALVISVVVHVVFTGATSFSLYGKWAEHGMFHEDYGLLSPSEIREIEQEARKEAREQERNAEMEARIEERRQQADLEMEDEEEDAGTEDAATPEPGDDAEPEAPEVEPLPPAEGFSLDDFGADS